MTADLKELERLALAATPGPWEWDDDVCNYDPEQQAPWLVTTGAQWPILTGGIKCDKRVDADYIAAANPAAILSLIAELEQCRRDAELLDWLEQKCCDVARRSSTALHISWNNGVDTVIVGPNHHATWRSAIASAIAKESA